MWLWKETTIEKYSYANEQSREKVSVEEGTSSSPEG
jgi:hypothetical protein